MSVNAATSNPPEGIVTRDRLRRTVTLSGHIDTIRAVLRDEENFPNDPFLRTAMAGLFGRSVLSTAGSEWHDHRDFLTGVFKSAGFDRRAETAVQNAIKAGLTTMQPGQPFDTHEQGNRFASAVIAEILFGSSIAPDVGAIVRSVMTNHRVSMATKINLLFYVAGLPMPFPVHAHKKMPRKQEVWTLIEWHRAQGEKAPRGGMLGAMMRARHPVTDAPYTDLFIHDNVCALIAAGFFTTGASIAYCVQNILGHPATLEAVKSEAARQDIAFAHPAQSHPKTFNAVRETLRLDPPVHTIMRRARTMRDFGDVRIPKGAAVHIDIGKLHRNPALFNEPDAFRPERFEGTIVTGSYMPFGFGGHACIGQRLAMFEMTAFIAALFQHDDMGVVSRIEGAGRSVVFAQPKGTLTLQIPAHR